MVNFSRTELYSTVKILNLCAQAQTESDVFRIIDEFKRLVPYEAAMMMTFKQGSGGQSLTAGMMNHSFSAQWLDIYNRNDYIAIDPLVRRAKLTNGVFSWSEGGLLVGDENSQDIPREMAKFSREMVQNNLLEGIAGGWRGNSCRDTQIVALFCLNRCVEYRHLEFLKQLLPLLRIAVQEALLSKKYDSRREVLVKSLTTREQEVLRWACIGKTSWEIGRILSITERTVKFHLNNTFNKLEVVNRPQAIAKAVDLGLV